LRFGFLSDCSISARLSTAACAVAGESLGKATAAVASVAALGADSACLLLLAVEVTRKVRG
jgi:hypothetical protein